MKFMVAFGLCFQLPVALTLMGIAGLVSSKGLSHFRRYALVCMLVVAAFVTPGPDVMTQVILFAAIYPLYEISILLVRFFERKREAELKAQGLWDEEAAEEVRERRDSALARIAAALERLSPPPQPAPDLVARGGVRLGDGAGPAGAGGAGVAGADRAPRRDRPVAGHAARQHPAVRAGVSRPTTCCSGARGGWGSRAWSRRCMPRRRRRRRG